MKVRWHFVLTANTTEPCEMYKFYQCRLCAQEDEKGCFWEECCGIAALYDGVIVNDVCSHLCLCASMSRD